MTREEREQAIAILENEKKCVNRANKNDYCNRDCYNCELVKTDIEILTALDMAIQALEQSMPTMVYPQVDGITPTVVAQADGEKTCGTCRNEDTYHCAECENKSDYEQAQADGEYIKKSDMIDWLKDIRHRMKPQNYHTASEFEIAENQIWNLIQMLQMGAFPSVAIPSAEPCEDAISRQAVLDLLEDTNNGWIINEVLQLPSVKPQEPKWIPVSERLPEEKMAVLVWCPEYKNIYCAYLEKKQWWIFGAFVQIVPNEVVAWMPLPKPYEPQESEE